MASAVQHAPNGRIEERHYRISELALMWGVSRGTVYNLLRGQDVVSFAQPGKRGVVLVPESTVNLILQKRRKTFR